MGIDTVRETLLAQHDQIRRDLAVCHHLAGRLRAGEPVAAELDRALDRLCVDFDHHNTTETRLLLPLLLQGSHGRDTRGTRLAERMLEEHIAEHDAFRQRLEGPRDEVAANLLELSEDLDAHMAAEERTFLNPTILGDDTRSLLAREEPL
jgi:iron-sulfur cluster repair protein YtfE (RIC family)